MASWCMLPQFVDDFKQKLKDGTIDPFKLANMSSQERHSFFAQFYGEDNATHVNGLFESKLLLKNQKSGYLAWAKKIAGITPQVRQDIYSKIERLDKVLSPSEEQEFLKDLASTKLGTEVTQQEAAHIVDLSQQISDAKAILDPKDKASITDLGVKMLNMTDYLNSITPHHTSLFDNLVNLANLPKSALTSVFHMSAPFVQGWGMTTTKEFWQGFGRMFSYFASEKSYRELQGYIIAHPDYPLAKDAHLGITHLGDKLNLREEAIQSSLLEHVPGLNVLVKASGRSFGGFLNYVRFTRFTNLLDSARLAGEDVSKGSHVVQDIADVVNDFTGRASLGKGDKYGNAAPALNALFFSPRKIRATMNMFNPVRYVDPRISPTARRAALGQLFGALMATGSIITLAKMSGATVETNPTSSKFGEIQIGNTSLDLTGGNKSFAVLLSRLYSGSVKNNSTDIQTSLTSGKFGSQNRLDIFQNYIRGKLSPIASAIADWMAGKDGAGNPVTWQSEAYQKLTPIVLQDLINFVQNDKTNTAAYIPALSGLFGVALTTAPAPKQNSWSQNPTKTQTDFLNKKGQDAFNQANQDFNTQYQSWLSAIKENPQYKAMDPTAQQALITAKKAELENKIFKQNGYKPTKTTSTRSEKIAKKALLQNP